MKNLLHDFLYDHLDDEYQTPKKIKKPKLEESLFKPQKKIDKPRKENAKKYCT